MPVKFNINDFEPIYYSTTGYPEFWECVYRDSIEHFSKIWGKVGPLYFFFSLLSVIGGFLTKKSMPEFLRIFLLEGEDEAKTIFILISLGSYV